MAEMERMAERLIPDLNTATVADNEVVEDNNQKSVLSKNTAKLAAKLQRTTRQLVVFDDLEDSTATDDNEDSAEDDDYLLRC
ncbi:hypothetical protein ACA910_002313 [Epithemia clementina (nom. ined.)]